MVLSGAAAQEGGGAGREGRHCEALWRAIGGSTMGDEAEGREIKDKV